MVNRGENEDGERKGKESATTQHSRSNSEYQTVFGNAMKKMLHTSVSNASLGFL